MDDTIPKWYADLLHELMLRGSAKRVFPIIGEVRFLSAGSLGDFIMYFPDGTTWSSTEYARRMMKDEDTRR